MKRRSEHITMNQLPPCLLQSVVLQRRERREGGAEEATLRGQEDDFEGPWG